MNIQQTQDKANTITEKNKELDKLLAFEKQLIQYNQNRNASLPHVARLQAPQSLPYVELKVIANPSGSLILLVGPPGQEQRLDVSAERAGKLGQDILVLTQAVVSEGITTKNEELKELLK